MSVMRPEVPGFDLGYFQVALTDVSRMFEVCEKDLGVNLGD